MCDFKYYDIVVCISKHRETALALAPAKFKTSHCVEALCFLPICSSHKVRGEK
jgi:hypothetical protein